MQAVYELCTRTISYDLYTPWSYTPRASSRALLRISFKGSKIERGAWQRSPKRRPNKVLPDASEGHKSLKIFL